MGGSKKSRWGGNFFFRGNSPPIPPPQGNPQVNKSKTKVIIFNLRGLTLNGNPAHTFLLEGAKIKVVKEYQYLGIKLKPSGSFTFAAAELYTKATRAYFSISNILYTSGSHKIQTASEKKIY